MAGNNLQKLGTHTPSKALANGAPSATLRSAPVWTFDGTDTQRLYAAYTVGQLSAPPPEAVTLQADQRTDKKVVVSSALSLPYLREQTSPTVRGFLALTPASSLKSKK